LLAEVDGLDQLTFEASGWLLGVLSGDAESIGELDQLRRFLANRVIETAASAHFISDFRDGDHLILHSNRRADAIILEALMRDQPDSDLIPKIVQGLQAHRTRGRWPSTQENAFVLLALDQYFRQFEDQEPDFIASVWLGPDFAGRHHFAGRTTDYHHVDIPMTYLAGTESGSRTSFSTRKGQGVCTTGSGCVMPPEALSSIRPATGSRSNDITAGLMTKMMCAAWIAVAGRFVPGRVWPSSSPWWRRPGAIMSPWSTLCRPAWRPSILPWRSANRP
jgi:hypothetical protein